MLIKNFNYFHFTALSQFVLLQIKLEWTGPLVKRCKVLVGAASCYCCEADGNRRVTVSCQLRVIKDSKHKRLSEHKHQLQSELFDFYLNGLQIQKAPARSVFCYISSNFRLTFFMASSLPGSRWRAAWLSYASCFLDGGLLEVI